MPTVVLARKNCTEPSLGAASPSRHVQRATPTETSVVGESARTTRRTKLNPHPSSRIRTRGRQHELGKTHFGSLNSGMAFQLVRFGTALWVVPEYRYVPTPRYLFVHRAGSSDEEESRGWEKGARPKVSLATRVPLTLTEPPTLAARAKLEVCALRGRCARTPGRSCCCDGWVG